MAKERTAVKKIKEILQLYETGVLSNRQIAKATGVSRPVVGEIVQKAKERAITYEAIKGLDEEAVETLFYAPRSAEEGERYGTLLTRFPSMSRELLRVGVTLKLLWEEYWAEQPHGYGYTQFCLYYRRWLKITEVSCPIPHKPGAELYIDFAGEKFYYIDRMTGERCETEVFVAILPASQYLYVEASESQKTQEVIRLSENAFHFIGGVTGAIILDNMKSAVNKADRYEPEINAKYLLFSEHYECAIIPTRVAKPKDKALVENVMRIVYQEIYAKLRNEIFYSLDELNVSIRSKLEELLDRPMKRFEMSRRELFEQIEKTTLKPLPMQRYQWKDHTTALIQYNYHVWFSEDKHYYSAPYQLRGKRVDVYTTGKTVEIYYERRRVGIHMRDRTVNGYTTDPAHMPEDHRRMGWTPEYLIEWAASYGESVEQMVREVLHSRRHPQQAFKSCNGILQLGKRFGIDRLERACERALRFGTVGYGVVKNILEKGHDKDPDEQTVFEELPYHENVRGGAYYEHISILNQEEQT